MLRVRARGFVSLHVFPVVFGRCCRRRTNWLQLFGILESVSRECLYWTKPVAYILDDLHEGTTQFRHAIIRHMMCTLVITLELLHSSSSYTLMPCLQYQSLTQVLISRHTQIDLHKLLV